ncbi:MAG: hypothetical protein A2Z49_07490 [Chloroflexi bacterium RBG_19FT_COMBO_56_12]|nr:MAG: hypothetical protein A2Z49_07490 [Chloroflexi bacterium RBG_19FT_COMBO_56_12]
MDKKMSEWNYFNLHNLVGMRVSRSASTASLFTDMFNPFQVERLEHADLTITEEQEPLENGAFGEVHGETEFFYNDRGLHLETPDVQVFVDEDGFRLHGDVELLVLALPLIDRLMIVKGAAMIHALTVEYNGYGVNMPAWGGTGKTSTMAKLLKRDGFAFMGDDWAFLSGDGDLLGYAKPMFIKPYHQSIYPHLFSNGHKPLVPISLSKRIHSMTTRVHPYITRYPKLAQITRRWSPEHMMVMPHRAFPEARFSNAAPLAVSLFVERFQSSSDEPVFEEKSKQWMISRLIGNFTSELPKQSRLVMTSLGASGLVPIEQAFEEKAAVLSQALEGKPNFYLRVPKHLTPDQASDIIVSKIEKVLVTAGVA